MASNCDFSDVNLMLIQAVCRGDADAVRVHVNEGGCCTLVYKGRTLLSQAAAYGHVEVMLALIDAFNGLNDPKNIENNSNKRGVDEEIATPDGMRELQWDTEIDSPETPGQESEDIWSRQYRWYAKILDKKVEALTDCDNRDSSVSSRVPFGYDRWIELSFSENQRGCELESKIKNFLSIQDAQNRLAMHYAAESGSIEAVRILMDYGCSINVSDVDALTPLHLAALRGHLETVNLLLVNGAPVNVLSTDKLTPLHYASSRGHLEVVQALLTNGANVNSLDSGERTPLALAVSRDLEDVARELIRAGARVNTEDIKGYTPLSQAVWKKNVEMAHLLIKNGAKLIPCNHLLHDAILHRHVAMIELLVNSGALLNARDNCGMTPLLIATHTSQPDVVRLLLEHGANVELGDGGLTPLMFCLSETNGEDLEVVKALLDAGADVGQFAIWSFETDAFTSAMLNGKTNSAILLLAYGAQVNNENIIELFDDFKIIKALIVTKNLKLPNKPQLEFPNIVDQQACEWLHYQRMNPLTLLQQSRIAIRRQRTPGHTMYQYVRSLDIPMILKKYLMLSEFYNRDILHFD